MAGEESKTSNELKLALLMIATTEGGIKVDNERLAKLWGEKVSANGMRQRVAKLKTMSKTQLEACSGGESGSKDETPKASPKATPKSNSGSKRKSATTSAEEDEETVEKTPSKKRATTKAAGTPAPKGRGRKSKKDSVSAEAEEEKEVIKAEDVKAKDDAALQVDGGADDDDVAI